ncbi:hypothetical protein [Bradyrhizobium sp. dw_411]|uniref:hypothetical protein n=1 Tax=Bradyrhizobium sp. dw_411 TaxID=2720082 RepID=UPI00201BE9A9|nr:hypothetical protein [Bradyrhizobium sp. dw_411]
MPRFTSIKKISLAVVVSAAMLMSISESYAGTGTVRLRVFKAGFIIGGGGGKGVLNYQGHIAYFRVGGIGVGTIGVAETRYAGVAYNLRSPADIYGTYSAAGAGIAVVGGAKVARLQNANGVVLELRGVQAGFEASLGLGGMTVTPL